MSAPFTQHFIFMGVCGSGKTTIGSAVAEKLSLVFYDADDFHSFENIAKMKKGIPLNDEDRANWLATLSTHIENLSIRGVSSVLACSALKQSYRAILAKIANNPHINTNIQFLWLDVPQKLILKRMKRRKFHFMSASLVQSQFDTLEIPNGELEHLIIHRIDASPQKFDIIVNECVDVLTQ